MGFRVDPSHIPKLDHLDQESGRFLAGTAYGPSRPWKQDWQLHGAVGNFVRLVDLAIGEYNLGRRATIDWWGPQRVLFTRAAGHFETCVTASHRAVCHLQAVRAHPGALPHLGSTFPSSPSVLSGAGDISVCNMRNAIQHLEERILGRGSHKDAQDQRNPFHKRQEDKACLKP
jgi:hypothetical protein